VQLVAENIQRETRACELSALRRRPSANHRPYRHNRRPIGRRGKKARALLKLRILIVFFLFPSDANYRLGIFSYLNCTKLFCALSLTISNIKVTVMFEN